MNGKTAIGVVLVFLGAWMVLKMFGISLGPIFGFLFPLILIGLGYVGIKNGKNMIGGVMLAIGIIILLGKLSGVIFFLLAVGAVVLGISLLRRSKNNVY
jgi:lia operon protein LiaI